MNKMNKKTSRLNLEEIDGIVEEDVCGGPSRNVGYVKGNTVYQEVMGGKPAVLGYVKEGIAYEMVCGGPDRIIGKVKSFNWL